MLFHGGIRVCVGITETLLFGKMKGVDCEHGAGGRVSRHSGAGQREAGDMSKEPWKGDNRGWQILQSLKPACST